MYKGASSFSENEVTDATWTSLQSELNSSPVRLEKFRVGSPWNYYSDLTTGNDAGVEYSYASFNCVAEMDLAKDKQSENADIHGDYTASAGTIQYESDGETLKNILSEESFDMTVVGPDYQFGEAYEFVEDIYEEEIFRSVDLIDVADIDPEAVDVIGFTSLKGSFNAVPNFETSFWRFTFGLEIPAEYFDLNAAFYGYVTYQRQDQGAPASTIACYTNFNNAEEKATGFEFDETFDFGADDNLPAWEKYFGASVEYSDWDISANLNDYALLSTTNGKMRQSCVVEVRIEPEEVAEFFNTAYDLTYGGAIYESWDSSDKKAVLAPKDTSFFVPAADFTFEPLETFQTDFQIWSVQLFNFDSVAVFPDVDFADNSQTELYFKGAFEVGVSDSA